jgi:hypothetical protein
VPYLRSSRVEHGLLINFGVPKFEIKKYALSRIGEGRRPGGLIGGTLLLLSLLRLFAAIPRACDAQSPKATSKPPQSLLIAKGLRP